MFHNKSFYVTYIPPKTVTNCFLVEPLPPVPVDDREKDLFELPDTHLLAQLVDDDNDDEIVESNELEPVTTLKKQRTTWSRQRADNNTNYHYVLPNVSAFSILNSHPNLYSIV